MIPGVKKQGGPEMFRNWRGQTRLEGQGSWLRVCKWSSEALRRPPEKQHSATILSRYCSAALSKSLVLRRALLDVTRK